MAAQRTARRERERQQMVAAWAGPLVEEEKRTKDMKETLATRLIIDLRNHMRKEAAQLRRRHVEQASSGAPASLPSESCGQKGTSRNTYEA